MTAQYLPILIMLVVSVILAAVLIGLSRLVGPNRHSASKLSPYECGVVPQGDTLGRFSIKYYLIGALFILFEVETIFLFAWAVVFKDLGALAFIEIIVFLFIILGGYFYVVKSGALEWE
ncbi:MAG: NADH-quinone oxidoreductase subunit A [Thermodesulfobacteriota bacterium]